MPETPGGSSPAPNSMAHRRQEATQRVLAACEERFAPPAFDVSCDETGVVWVRRLQGEARSIGLQPWLLRERSIEEIVERVESKLGREGTH